MVRREEVKKGGGNECVEKAPALGKSQRTTQSESISIYATRANWKTQAVYINEKSRIKKRRSSTRIKISLFFAYASIFGRDSEQP